MFEANTTLKSRIVSDIATTFGPTPTVKIYSGTEPDTSTVQTFDPANHTGAELITFANVDVESFSTTGINAVRMVTSDPVHTANATATGTATWGAIYNTSTTDICIVGNVSQSPNDAHFTISNVTVTSGASFTLEDFYVDLGG